MPAATQLSDTSTNSTPGFPRSLERSWYSLLALIFVLALGLRLYYNFLAPHVNTYRIADASEYLRNAQTILNLKNQPVRFWQDCISCLSGGATLETIDAIRRTFEPLHDLHITGPIFPLFLLLASAICRTPFSDLNWLAPLAVQSVLSALSCILIALTASHAWDKRTGIAAGLISAIYPAFIVNSGRLYSESFATFLLCMLLWLTVRGFAAKGNSLWAVALNGFIASALELTRSVMLIPALVLIPITVFGQPKRRRWVSVIAFLSGFALIAIPWFAWQKLAFGTGSLLVDRVGHYNLFIGTNVDSSGWLSIPYPDGRGIESKSLGQLTAESFRRSPSRWLKLMLDKPLRLFKFPWNDFRTPIGSIDQWLQVLIHQLLLLMTAIGLAIGFTVNAGRGPPEKSQMYGRWFIFGLLAFHSVYFFFITVPRYNLTAMPLIILLSATGTTNLLRLLRKPSSAPLAPYLILMSALALFAIARLDLLALVAALPGFSNVWLCLMVSCLIKTLTVAVFAFALWRGTAELPGNRTTARVCTAMLAVLCFSTICLPARAHGRWWEWQTMLNEPGQKIVQLIPLSREQLQQMKMRQTYLLIDSDGAQALLDGLTIAVNGTRLTGPTIPSLSLVSDLSHFQQQPDNHLSVECDYIFDCLTIGTGTSNRDLRQWFLIPLPQDLPVDPERRCLKVEISKTSRSRTVLFGTYRTNDKYVDIPSLTRCSWEKCFYGVENDRGLTDSRYDDRIMLNDTASPAFRTDDLSSAPGRQSGCFNIRLLLGPPTARQPFLTRLLTRDFSVPAMQPSSQTTVIQKFHELPPWSQGDLWTVRIKGQIKTSDNSALAEISVSASSKTDRKHLLTYRIPWSPRGISSPGHWTTLDFSFPLNPSALPGSLQELDATFNIVGANPRDYGVPKPKSSVQLQNLQLEIYRLPSAPLASGHRII